MITGILTIIALIHVIAIVVGTVAAISTAIDEIRSNRN